MTNEKLVELLVRCKADAQVLFMTESGGVYDISNTLVTSTVVGNRTHQSIILRGGNALPAAKDDGG